LLLCVALLSGCTSAQLEMSLGPSFSHDATVAIDLPETMSVPASSYAGPSPSAGAAEAASLAEIELAAVPPKAEIKPDRGRGEVDRLIVKYAELYEVPESLVRRVVKRESNFVPGAYNNGHWGLMQIKHATARGMGYGGPAKGLLDAETNLKYAVKYLRGAWLVAEGNPDRAVRFYAAGYYYDAKRMGLLDETGLGRDRKRKRI
jgi:soluble lytic murein transglycosylase-like protein